MSLFNVPFFERVNRHLSPKSAPRHWVFGGFDTLTGSETHRFKRSPDLTDKTSLTSSHSLPRQPEPDGLHVPTTAIIDPTSVLEVGNLSKLENLHVKTFVKKCTVKTIPKMFYFFDCYVGLRQ